MKEAPEVTFENDRLDDASDAEEKGREAVAMAKATEVSLSVWLRDQALQWYKRYALLNRDVTYPWPGASDIVMPMSDMHIGKLKPPFMNALFGGPRWINMRPRSAASWGSKAAADLALESLLRGGGPHAIPDFKLQIAYGVDNMMWSGRGIWKTGYEYLVVTRSETVRAGSLPGMLGRLSIVPDITPFAREMHQRWYPWLNAPDVLQWLGATEPVQPMDRATFDKYAPVIKAEVIKLYGLDADEKIDKRACEDIMRFLRAGPSRKQSIDVTLRFVERDGPSLMAVSPFDFIVPWGTRVDLTGTDQVWHRIVYTEAELERRAGVKKWNALEVEKAMEGGKVTWMHPGNNITMRPREYGHLVTGEAFAKSNLVALLDGYIREDVHGDGAATWVNYLIEPNSGAVLKRREHRAAHGKPPFVVAPLEHNSDDYFESRGVPKILRDAEGHATALYRAIENNLILTTTPTFKARQTAFLDPEGAQVIPGEVLPVERMDDIQQFDMQSNTFPLHQLLASFMPWPEQLVGSLDISAASNQRLLEPRTRYEVERVSSFQMGVAGLRVDLFMPHFAELCSQLWMLFRQYGPESFYVHVTGEDPTRLTQAQIHGEFDVIPAGASGDMDPNFRFQRAMNVLQMGAQFEPLLANDPRWVADRAQLFIYALNEFDPLLRQMYLKRRTPEEQAAFMKDLEDRAARAEKLADIAERVEKNTGISKAEGALVLSEIAKRLPHKVLTEIQAEGQAATQAKRDASALARA